MTTTQLPVFERNHYGRNVGTRVYVSVRVLVDEISVVSYTNIRVTVSFVFTSFYKLVTFKSLTHAVYEYKPTNQLS